MASCRAACVEDDDFYTVIMQYLANHFGAHRPQRVLLSATLRPGKQDGRLGSSAGHFHYIAMQVEMNNVEVSLAILLRGIVKMSLKCFKCSWTHNLDLELKGRFLGCF
jgi:hypothetical protein